MKHIVLPEEPTEDIIKVLMSEGPFLYRVRGDYYEVLQRAGPAVDAVLLHVQVYRPDEARAEVRERNAKWKYAQLAQLAHLAATSSHCCVDIFSSRCCERGTKSCTVRHPESAL